MHIKQMPWRKQIETKYSEAELILRGGVASFKKKHHQLIDVLAKLEGREKKYGGLIEIFGDSKEMTLAIILQNCMHPKNSQRTDSIKNGTYVEIKTKKEAVVFLANLLSKHLKHELQSAISEVEEKFQELEQVKDIGLLMHAPDVYIAAAILGNKEFYHGRGDRTAFLKQIL